MHRLRRAFLMDRYPLCWKSHLTDRREASRHCDNRQLAPVETTGREPEMEDQEPYTLPRPENTGGIDHAQRGRSLWLIFS